MLLCAVLAACGPDDGDGGGNCEAALLAGDLVITEIMANPDGDDAGNEYFEVFNATSGTIDLTGLVLVSSREDMTDERTHVVRDRSIDPGQYLVFGGVAEEFKPVHVDYGYANDLSSLRNSGGRIALRCQSVEVDTVEYGEMDDGIAQGLDGNITPNNIDNDDLANFCPATTEFSTGNFGSPGEANEACNVVLPGMCNDGTADRAVVFPTVGDLVITELMPNPAGVADTDGEWFEMVALADFDLNGVVVGREVGVAGAQVVDSNCISVTTGDLVVFAKDTDPLVNGGINNVDATFNFSLVNSNGTLFVGIGPDVLDIVTWTSSTSGVSLQLDSGSNDPDSNDDESLFCDGTMDYSGMGTDLGSPGLANAPCVGGSTCLDNGTPRQINTVAMGDVVISEWMPNPDANNMGAGTDNLGEWLEVRFVNAGDLNGLRIRDGQAGDSTVVDANCLAFDAGGHAVIARSADPLLNGALPQVDATFNVGLNQTNETISIGIADDVFDSVMYAASTAGVSQQVDLGGNQCETDNTVNVVTYGDGDTGTPSLVNEDCN